MDHLTGGFLFLKCGKICRQFRNSRLEGLLFGSRKFLNWLGYLGGCHFAVVVDRQKLDRIGDDCATALHRNLNRVPLAGWKFKKTKRLEIAIRPVLVKSTRGLSLVDAKGFASIIMEDLHESFGRSIRVLSNCNAYLVPTFSRKSHGINDFAALGAGEEVLRTNVIWNAAGFRPSADDFCFRVVHNNPR